jgi:prolyl 4-hydroxylase
MYNKIVMNTLPIVLIVLLILIVLSAIIAMAVIGPKRKGHGCRENWLSNRGPVDELIRAVATEVKGNDETPLYIIDNFLSEYECDTIIAETAHKLVPSALTRAAPGDPNFRTSETAYFDNTGIQPSIEEKILSLLQLPKESAESAQVQRYKVGNEFKAHYDFFHPGEDDVHLERGQRTWTFTMYLNDVEQGGHTYFPELKQGVVPKKGRAAIWCNLRLDGEVDNNTLHQGSPVEKGEKYIVTKWLRDKLED